MKNNANLQQFIYQKPKELRLGQWFVNSYCKPINGKWEQLCDVLYNADDEKALRLIKYMMQIWQWDSLPEITKC